MNRFKQKRNKLYIFSILCKASYRNLSLFFFFVFNSKTIVMEKITFQQMRDFTSAGDLIVSKFLDTLPTET